MKRIILLIFFIGTGASMASVLPIAHRGASAYAPENTLSAILKAIELKSKYIEVDVHMSKDGEIVVIHDQTVDRTSSGSGRVYEKSLRGLKELDFGSWFGPDFKGEKIPTLREVLAVIPQGYTLIIELKDEGEIYNNIKKKIIKQVKEYNLENQVILKSFSFKILNTFEALAPEIERLYCTFGGNSWITLDNFLRFKSIFEGSQFSYLQVHKFFLGTSLIKQSHQRGIKIIVWDVHDQDTIDKFKSLGVDFIESNNPDLVFETK